MFLFISIFLFRVINYWNKLEYGCYYHIYNRSVSGELLFRDESDYQFFVKKYKECFVPYLDIYAYCLIPNHFHFIVKIKSKEDVAKSIEFETSRAWEKYKQKKIELDQFLSDQLRRLFSSIAMRYNARYKRRGALFQEKVKRVWIKVDDKLRYLIAYVHHNPIHHGLKKNYQEWLYSSWTGFLLDRPSLLARCEVLDLFGNKEKYVDFHESFRLMKIGEEVDAEF